MKLSIITLNFRKKDLTMQCMQSLYQKYQKEFEKDFELIIVDNFSEDDSVSELKQEIKKKQYKNCYIIENSKNAGFGAGNNFGAKYAKGAYILFLNNDTIIENGILEMLNYMEKHKDIGILGGPLKNFDGTEQVSVGKFATLSSTVLLLLGLQRIGLIDQNPKKVTRVDWVKGALCMIRKECFEKLQGFDEKIFMYTEDMELCFRARKKGINVSFYPDVSILHKDQGTTNRSFAIVHIYQGLLYFFSKHKPAWQYTLIRTILRTKARLLIFVGKLYNNTYLIQTYGQALAVT